MNIKILASGSSGNCYSVSDGETTILLECGISIKEIKKGLGFRLSSVAACLITHEHKDHCKSVEDIIKAGIDVYMSGGTQEALNITGHRANVIKNKETIKIGTFAVMAFDTEHDATEPIGYLLYSMATKEKLLFATDTYYIRYRFPGLTHIMVECNYAADILYNNIDEGLVTSSMKNRLLQSHFSLENVKEFLKVNNLSNVKEIYLMHLSARNSDEERFKREIQELTGKMVFIA